MSKSNIPKSAITERELMKLMKKEAKKSSSLSAWAVERGITAQQATAFLRKTQGAGLKLPEVLGYRPQTIFIPLDAELINFLPPPRFKATKRPTKKVDHTQDPVSKRGLKAKNERKETKKRLKKKNR